MKLIVGLGNPGREYDKTRHNVGFMVVDTIVSNLGLSFNKEKFDGMLAEVMINQEKIMILKPQRYINLSGEVIKKYVDFYKINVDDILIISDDLDLEVGKMKLRKQGGSGGHNGLKNIELNLKTKNYKRLKIGISNNKMIDTKDYVLSKFSKTDQEKINQIIDKTPSIINDYLSMTFDNLMNKYN